MIGIEAIGTYLPAGRLNNLERASAFDVAPEFVQSRTGFCRLALKAPDETTVSMAEAAVRDLLAKTGMVPEAVEALVVVTQNPDRNIPHVSAELHGHLGLDSRCACFDISLGCSGYIYGLSALAGFMAANGLRRGILVTADPYSKVVDPADKNTALIFGDAATATLLSDSPRYTMGGFTFGTLGKEADNLACNDGTLYMNGRAVFNFAATHVPSDIRQVLDKNGATIEDVDAFVLHPGSRYIVETIATRLGLPQEKVRFSSADYGNTVSSSIPMVLSEEIENRAIRTILLSGFGLGFSWSSTILKRREIQ